MADSPGSFSASRSAGRLTRGGARWRSRQSVPTVLENLRRLRRAAVLPNRNGCGLELVPLVRLKVHAIGVRKPYARARLAKIRVLGIERGAGHPAWGCT